MVWGLAFPFGCDDAGRRRRRGCRRRGALAVLFAVFLAVLLAMLAFAIDVGYILSAQTDLQRSIDSGALAGAGAIVDGIDQAEDAVREYIRRNPVGGFPLTDDDIEVQTGLWNPSSHEFTPTTNLPSAVWARATARDLPLFFGPVFNRWNFTIQREAIAMYQPREISVVLDFSASMSDDSELRNVSHLGTPAIVANLQTIWQQLGSPVYGNMAFSPVYIASDDTNTVLTQLALTSVPYPYPSGSWSDYINYVRTDGFVSAAGYQKEYGMLTLVNYWVDRQPSVTQTPTLWQTSEQPITAVKDALALFLAYVEEVDTDDRVGLVVYSHPTTGAKLEVSLTDDFDLIETTARHRQAGHYVGNTNIGAGLHEARLDLQNHARAGTFKFIVLMTDGIANLPTANPTQYVLDECNLCAAAGYPVVTISLGTEADTTLMQQVADITGGIHFNVPGGGSIADYENQLRDAFRQIADHRPLKIVK